MSSGWGFDSCGKNGMRMDTDRKVNSGGVDGVIRFALYARLVAAGK